MVIKLTKNGTLTLKLTFDIRSRGSPALLKARVVTWELWFAQAFVNSVVPKTDPDTKILAT